MKTTLADTVRTSLKASIEREARYHRTQSTRNKNLVKTYSVKT